MKILNLIIKQKYFDEILAGTKKEEYREVRPTTFKKYLRYVVRGEEFDTLEEAEKHFKIDRAKDDDYEFDTVPIKYDALRLYVGYNKDRDSMLVKVNNIVEETFVDENDEPIYYDHKGVVYMLSQMVYELGEILETDIHDKSK